MSEYRRNLLTNIGEMREENVLNAFDWIIISINIKFNVEFFREFSDKIFWNEISRKHKFSNELLIEFKDFISWDVYLVYHPIEFSILKKVILKSKIRSAQLIHPGYTTVEHKEIQKILDIKYMFQK